MTAQEQMRKMLDQLMGSGRDGNPESGGIHFTDPTVCRAFMTGLCPHTLFTNTKMDLGECPKVHSEALRADFEEANKKKNYGFEKEALEILDDFLRTCDRKVEAAKKRLEDQELDAESESRANKVHDIAEQIGQKLAKAEQLGNEGEVEESVALLTEIEKLKAEKRQGEEEYRNNLPQPQLQQQKLRVCEVCAAYLCLYDNDRSIGLPRTNTGLGVDTKLSKCPPGTTLEDHCNAVGKAVINASKTQKTQQVLADHFGGKLHMGFIQIREKRNVIQKLLDDKVLISEESMDRDTFTSKNNEYKRETSNGGNGATARSANPRPRSEYSYSATYRRQRSPSRERSRRRRSRSRSPRYRRSRSRSHRSRSKDRRSRSKDRRSKSKDRRSRDRRSRSGKRSDSRSPRDRPSRDDRKRRHSSSSSSGSSSSSSGRSRSGKSRSSASP